MYDFTRPTLTWLLDQGWSDKPAMPWIEVSERRKAETDWSEPHLAPRDFISAFAGIKLIVEVDDPKKAVGAKQFDFDILTLIRNVDQDGLDILRRQFDLELRYIGYANFAYSKSELEQQIFYGWHIVYISDNGEIYGEFNNVLSKYGFSVEDSLERFLQNKELYW